MLSTPFQILVALAGWVNEQQLAVIEYLKEENRVLREQVLAVIEYLKEENRVLREQVGRKRLRYR